MFNPLDYDIDTERLKRVLALNALGGKAKHPYLYMKAMQWERTAKFNLDNAIPITYDKFWKDISGDRNVVYESNGFVGKTGYGYVLQEGTGTNYYKNVTVVADHDTIVEGRRYELRVRFPGGNNKRPRSAYYEWPDAIYNDGNLINIIRKCGGKVDRWTTEGVPFPYMVRTWQDPGYIKYYGNKPETWALYKMYASDPYCGAKYYLTASEGPLR